MIERLVSVVISIGFKYC